MGRDDRRAAARDDPGDRGGLMGYLVFARQEYQRPLEWIGRLQDDGVAGDQGDLAAELVQQQALERFGDDEWIEMVAVPERALVTVIPLE